MCLYFHLFILQTFKILFYFWLHWVFIAVCGLSLVAEQELLSSWGARALTAMAALLVEHRLRGTGSVVAAHGL